MAWRRKTTKGTGRFINLGVSTTPSRPQSVAETQISTAPRVLGLRALCGGLMVSMTGVPRLFRPA